MGSKSKKNKKEAKENPDAKMEVEISRSRVFGGSNKAITDERFAMSQKDPRFQDVPKHKTKVAIDTRFSRMFTDKNFSSSTARVDKRGRVKQDGDSSQSALKHYYRIDDEAKKQKKQREESDDDVESEQENGESESDDAEKSKKVRQTFSKSKPELESESESESGSESLGEEEEEDYMDDSTSTDTDEEDAAYIEEETTPLQVEENVPEIDKETHRLAIVNLDWNQVRAVDLYVVLSSFLPKTGQILSVSVYPSDFGLKRMEEEAVRGPVGLFDDEDNKNKDDDSDDDDTEIDNEKLRAYELNRLRYYYAVVVCDSVGTADYLYKSCDGIEFERSSNMLDLRFIPDSFEFKHPPRDVATEAPADYEGLNFQTRALQLSKVDLTWDENEPQRSKKFKRKINADKESEYVKDEEHFKDLMASSDSDSDEDDNNTNPKKKQKTDEYRALISNTNSDSDSDEKEDNGMEMEVTFNTGLEDLSKRILEKKDKKSESVWEAHLRKMKEKKKARKAKSMDSDDSDCEPVVESGDFFAGDSVKKDKKGKKEEMELDKEGEATKEELELLLGDDDGNVKGYNLKKKKSKGQKGKKGKKEGMDEEKIPTVDYDDPRFSSLFTRHDYALDPTDPQFKRSAAYVRQVAHKQHKGDLDRKNDSLEYEQIELLLGDDDGNVKGYNLKKKKSKGQKGKKGKKEGMDEEKIPTVDYDDPRFSSLFTRHDYALDPTDPQFKRSAAYVRQVAHKQHKGDLDRKNDSLEYEQIEGSKADDKVDDARKDKHEISMLLKSVKMKSKQLPMPSDGNKLKRKEKK